MKTKATKNRARFARGSRRLKPATTSAPRTDAIGMTRPFPRLKTIVVPVDFSTESLKALRYAVPFAEQFGATLCLVHVIEYAAFMNDTPKMVLLEPGLQQVRRVREDLLALEQKEIEELVPVKTEILVGEPAHQIIETAKRLNADLIIIATRGRTGLTRVLLGSTAELVVRRAPCPVLVVREKEREFV